MLSQVFVFLVPFAIVIMSYTSIECYPYLPEVLNRERSYNENNGIRRILDRMIEMRERKDGRELETDRNYDDIKDISGTDIPEANNTFYQPTPKRLIMPAFDQNNLNVPDDFKDISGTDIPEANNTFYQPTQKRLRMLAFDKNNLNVPDDFKDISGTDIPEANNTFYQPTQKRLRILAFDKNNLNVPDVRTILDRRIEMRDREGRRKLETTEYWINDLEDIPPSDMRIGTKVDNRKRQENKDDLKVLSGNDIIKANRSFYQPAPKRLRMPAFDKNNLNVPDDFKDISGTDIPEANNTFYQPTQKRLRMLVFDKNNLNVPDYGFYPLSLEDLDTFKEEGKIEKDHFKRMASELYLSLWKLLDRVEDQNK